MIRSLTKRYGRSTLSGGGTLGEASPIAVSTCMPHGGVLSDVVCADTPGVPGCKPGEYGNHFVCFDGTTCDWQAGGDGMPICGPPVTLPPQGSPCNDQGGAGTYDANGNCTHVQQAHYPGDPCTTPGNGPGTYAADNVTCKPDPGSPCSDQGGPGTFDANGNCTHVQLDHYPGDACTTPDGKAGVWGADNATCLVLDASGKPGTPPPPPGTPPPVPHGGTTTQPSLLRRAVPYVLGGAAVVAAGVGVKKGYEHFKAKSAAKKK